MMDFQFSQSMKMSQQMKLTPAMIQSMEILQMSTIKLEERVAAELEINPTLEAGEFEGDAGEIRQVEQESGEGGESGGSGEGDGDGGEDGFWDGSDEVGRGGEGEDEFGGVGQVREDVPMDMTDRSSKDDFERLDSFEAEHPEFAQNDYESGASEGVGERGERTASFDERREHAGGAGGDDVDAKGQAMAATPCRDMSLVEQLLEQWRMSDVAGAMKPLGEYILGFIDEDGFIRTSVAEIAERAPSGLVRGLMAKGVGEGSGVSASVIEKGIMALQLVLEPAGIAARDTRECLLLQIDAREAALGTERVDADELALYELARRVVDEHLEDLKNNRLPRVAMKLGVDVERLKLAVGKLRGLSLAPARQLVDGREPGIVPDAIVEYDAQGDRYYAYLNDRRLANLRLNEEYAKLAKDKGAGKQTREFLKKSLGSAEFLIQAIEQRKRTILRVIEAIIEHQRDFFDFGPSAIRPLPMAKIADQIGVHVATVSRAVSEKFIQTPRGVVALRKFFTGGTTTESGEEVSWDAIRGALEEIVSGEDKKRPLSDDAIAEALKGRGFDIARRTVAKYREQLSIPTGRLRKVH